jgi:hypothetical protein
MTKRQNQRGDQLGRIKQYMQTNAITPPIARATALLTEVNTLHDGMLAHGSEQDGGGNTFRSGSTQRKLLRKEILATVTEISETARALDPAQHPGVRDLFRLNQARDSYQNLVNTTSGFLDQLAAAPVKALFTDRGFPADFETALEAKLTAFAAATGIKWQGRQTKKTGTAGLDEMNRRAVVVVHELSAIVTKHLRLTNPTLLPVWEVAARAYVPAVTTPETPPDGSGSGSGSGSTPPPAGS